MVFVNSGGYRGTFRVYVNGELVIERAFFALDTVVGQLVYPGAGRNTSLGAPSRFTGSLARLRGYEGGLGQDAVRAATAAAKGDLHGP